MQSEELSEDKLTDIKEENGCDKKYEDVSKEVTPAKHFTLKEFSEIFQNVERAKNKILEVRKECNISPKHRRDACSVLLMI